MLTSKKLIIVGFSGFGKEVHFLASRLGLVIHGFLDDNPAVQGHVFSSARVLDTIDQWIKYDDCAFVIAVGNPRVRKKILSKMLLSGSPDFATLIDPAAIVMTEQVSVGAGSIICAGTICTVDIEIGAHVIINLNCTVGHETRLEDFVTVAPLVAISGNVLIGEAAEVGTGASIRQGLTIGRGGMLGMGSVLTKNIPENTVFFGSPAKAFKTIAD
ncbi:acetyltransferase [Pseudomonas sp. NA-150]|uniref:acetyltransferase n=1 Tax=Pseudomonas sp. NA-150 TaxID=3367525 RepID=UPI0037CB69D9